MFSVPKPALRGTEHKSGACQHEENRWEVSAEGIFRIPGLIVSSWKGFLDKPLIVSATVKNGNTSWFMVSRAAMLHSRTIDTQILNNRFSYDGSRHLKTCFVRQNPTSVTVNHILDRRIIDGLSPRSHDCAIFVTIRRSFTKTNWIFFFFLVHSLSTFQLS